MALTWNETVDLLTLLAAVDKRTVTQQEVQFWNIASNDGQWPSLRFAVAAAIKHTNEKPDVWLRSGHITQQWYRLRDEINEGFHWEGPSREVVDAGSAAIGAAHREAIQDHRQRSISAYCQSIGVPVNISELVDGDVALQLP